MNKQLTDPFDLMIDYMFQGMMMVVVILVVIPMLPVAKAAQQYFESMSYQGRTEPPYMLDAQPFVQHLDIKNPWISAYFYNVGNEYEAIISLNEPDSGNGFIIYPNDAIFVIRLGAKERISSIYYSSPHHTTLRVIGEW